MKNSPFHPPALPDKPPLSPWTSPTDEPDPSTETGRPLGQDRLSWRNSLAAFIRFVPAELEYVTLPPWQSIQNMVHTMTITGSVEQHPHWRPTNVSSGCRSEDSDTPSGSWVPTYAPGHTRDRLDLMTWLGRWTAHYTWTWRGAGADNFVGVAALNLMERWAAIAWNAQSNVPEWCRDAVEELNCDIDRSGRLEHAPVLPWADARQDVSAFLAGWQQERVRLGRHAGRRRSAQHRSAALAQSVTKALTLLRILKAIDPGSLPDQDIAAIQNMGRLVHEPLDDPDLETGLQVLEDRARLERRLARVKAPVVGRSVRRRAL